MTRRAILPAVALLLASVQARAQDFTNLPIIGDFFSTPDMPFLTPGTDIPILGGGSITYCINCSTQLQQGLQLAQEAISAARAVDMLANMVTQGKNQPVNLFGDLTQAITTVSNISQQASLLGDNAGQMITNMSTPGWYAGIGEYSSPLSASFTEENLAITNALRQFGTLLNLQPINLQNASAVLNSLQNLATTLDRNAILQTSTQANAATGQLIAHQQAAITAGIQGQLTVELAKINHESYADAYTNASESGAITAACVAAAQTPFGAGGISFCHDYLQ